MITIIKPFNSYCLDHAPESEYRAWYQAIVCGQNLPPSKEKGWFQQTGLIHVIVVSGSHLIFLEDVILWTLGKSRWAAVIRWPALLLFTALSNLQPPITRALIHRTLSWICHSLHRPLPAVHLQILSGLTTLALFPGWWTSLSFLLSWFCGLGLSLPLNSKSGLWRSILIYFVLIPALLSVQMPHPSSILFNALFGPVLGLVLFPMSMLAFLHPWLTWACDGGWRILFWIFAILPMPDPGGGQSFAKAWLYMYLALAQGGGVIFYIKTKRRLWRTL